MPIRPENRNRYPADLRAMCQSCHLHYDRDQHAQTRARLLRERETAGMDPIPGV